MEEAELSNLLDGLAKRFEEAEQPAPENESACGWGQFLGGSIRRRQIGLYGTCSGILVRALAGRANTGGLSDKVGVLISDWWKNRDSDRRVQERLSQTLRLAFLNLALRISRLRAVEEVRAEVEQTLRARLLKEGLWGNYWFSEQIHDPTPRLFPSSIALLSFTLLQQAPPTDETLFGVADRLQERLLGDKRLSALHSAAAAAAILATKGGTLGRKTRARIEKLAYSSQPNIRDLGVYFFEFHSEPNGSERFSRDYFITPVALLVAIAGFQPYAPAPLRLRAENTLKTLMKNVEKDGAYRSDADEQLVSSKNQAWAALLLKVSTGSHRPVGLPRRVEYALIRPRSENWWTEKLLPTGSVVIATIANLIVQGDPSYARRAVVLVLGLIITSLYGKTAFRTFFPGRE